MCMKRGFDSFIEATVYIIRKRLDSVVYHCEKCSRYHIRRE